MIIQDRHRPTVAERRLRWRARVRPGLLKFPSYLVDQPFHPSCVRSLDKVIAIKMARFNGDES